MSTNIGSLHRWSRMLAYLGILSLILSCTTIGLGSSTIAEGILQLDDGIIKVQNQDGDWEPMAGDSTFDLVGTLESSEPWKVSGRTVQTNDASQITQGLEVGDLVRVRGAILENDIWLAYSIEPAGEQKDQTITIIGRATSVDPWVVNDVTLNVTDDTLITGDIKPGMLVRVEILLLEDGTWEVISISPVGDLVPTSGCATVIATVVSVNGDQVQFLGWPAPVTVGDNSKDDNDNNDLEENNDDQGEDENNDENENEDDGDEGDEGVDITILQPGQQVVVVVCVSDNNQLVIVKITILDDDKNETGNGEKVLVCHKPDKKGGHTISISSSAVPAHLAHGDTMGPCP